MGIKGIAAALAAILEAKRDVTAATGAPVAPASSRLEMLTREQLRTGHKLRVGVDGKALLYAGVRRLMNDMTFNSDHQPVRSDEWTLLCNLFEQHARGNAAATEQLRDGMEIPGTNLLKYVHAVVDELCKKYDCTVVFDGEDLPAKAGERDRRDGIAKQALLEAVKSIGEEDAPSATIHVANAIRPTAAMIRDTVRSLRAHEVNAMIAPYEADAQLAYLARTKHVDAVLTRDADLLTFGTPVVMLHSAGNACALEHVFFLDEIEACIGEGRLVDACVISGCDYATECVAKGGIAGALERVAAPSVEDCALTACEAAQLARYVYAHQVVYDPASKTRRHLTPLRPGVDVPGYHPKLGDLWNDPSHHVNKACFHAAGTHLADGTEARVGAWPITIDVPPLAGLKAVTRVRTPAVTGRVTFARLGKPISGGFIRL